SPLSTTEKATFTAPVPPVIMNVLYTSGWPSVMACWELLPGIRALPDAVPDRVRADASPCPVAYVTAASALATALVLTYCWFSSPRLFWAWTKDSAVHEPPYTTVPAEGAMVRLVNVRLAEANASASTRRGNDNIR